MSGQLEVWQKKPVMVEVRQFRDWSDGIAICNWADNTYYVGRGHEHPLRRPEEFDRGNGHIRDDAPNFLVIRTLEGMMRADAGDYVIKGVQGEFYPCKPDIFKETYEKVTDGNV